jgi:cytochrome c553
MRASTLSLNQRAISLSAGISILCIGSAAGQPALQQPNVARGAIIAAQGLAGHAPACAQCHAYNGASNGSGAFPRVAGQSAYYLAKALRDYASGVRTNAVMTPIAKALSADDTANVAAYYSSVNAPYPTLSSTDPVPISRGKQLATIGDAAKELQSCNNCHGAGGAGEPPAIPYLAGQYDLYIASQLTLWQRGLRNDSPAAMADIAKRLDPKDIAAVAAYYQQLDASDVAAAAPAK